MVHHHRNTKYETVKEKKYTNAIPLNWIDVINK